MMGYSPKSSGSDLRQDVDSNLSPNGFLSRRNSLFSSSVIPLSSKTQHFQVIRQTSSFPGNSPLGSTVPSLPLQGLTHNDHDFTQNSPFSSRNHQTITSTKHNTANNKMAPRSSRESTPGFYDMPSCRNTNSALSNLSSEYENMMMGYFMPQNFNAEILDTSNKICGQQASSLSHEFRNSVSGTSYSIPNNESHRYSSVPDQIKSTIQQTCNFPESQDNITAFHRRKNTLKRSKKIQQSISDETVSGCLPKFQLDFEENSSTQRTTSTDLPSIITPQSAKEKFFMHSDNPISTILTENIHPQTHKPDPLWDRYSVLPSVSSSAASHSYAGDDDNISLLSCSSLQNNAQNVLNSGFYNSSPSSVTLSDMSTMTISNQRQSSERVSYAGFSRNKRALSNSPLSAESIDLNSIIRMSPTSLIPYINGSRSSSCVSPGSNGERSGSYSFGHLSARNSSSSPNSGSTSSGNKRSTSITPQTEASGLNSNIIYNVFNNFDKERDKNAYINLNDNLFVTQSIPSRLPHNNSAASALAEVEANVMHSPQMTPDCENLYVLPQDLAAIATDDFLPFISDVLPPQLFSQQYEPPIKNEEPTTLNLLKPPPTYDQHMARKAMLQKAGSSDSSQPSNSSSFESSEGDKTITGSSSTDTDSGIAFTCKWIQCSKNFQEQEDFVAHIEKVHIDQKKGEEYICYWELCPRNLHPFNARYKLLVHMRIHSGDKPNKCTYSGCKRAFSRLENLKIHLRSHTGEKPYACTYLGCTKTFSNSSDRTKHQKTHQDTKPYVCQVADCGKRYTDFSSLCRHAKKSHPGKKELDRKKYSGCKRAFSRLENLKIHLRSHTGEKAYACTYPGCTKTFSNSSDRTKHQKTHQDTKPYVCQVADCGKRYTHPNSLRRHAKKSHPDKKEPDRKKIRGSAENLNMRDLNECLTAQSMKPIISLLRDLSPPEPTDSGLGRSPRSPQLGSSIDFYPGVADYEESILQSSQMPAISPQNEIDRENLPANNSKLRVPILPRISTTCSAEESHSASSIIPNSINAALQKSDSIREQESSKIFRLSPPNFFKYLPKFEKYSGL